MAVRHSTESERRPGGAARRSRYGTCMSIILMLAVLLVLLAVLGAGIVGIVVLVSRKSKNSAVDAGRNGMGGWYPDPQYPDVDRYHDGHAWTAHTRPASAQTSSRPAHLA